MSKILTFFIFSLLYIASAMGKVPIEVTPHQPSEPLTLWYTAPATNWTREALPIGNGQFRGEHGVGEWTFANTSHTFAQRHALGAGLPWHRKGTGSGSS